MICEVVITKKFDGTSVTAIYCNGEVATDEMRIAFNELKSSENKYHGSSDHNKTEIDTTLNSNSIDNNNRNDLFYVCGRNIIINPPYPNLVFEQSFKSRDFYIPL